MSNIKVKIRFDDTNNTTFEYDRIKGFNSLNILNESKTDVNIDYSVKSSTGTFNATDISSFGLATLNSNSVNFNNSDCFSDICYNDVDNYFYFSNNFDGEHYIINRTKDFINFEHPQPTTTSKFDINNTRIAKFGNSIAISMVEGNSFGAMIYDSLNNSWTSNNFVQNAVNVKFIGFFVINNYLFSSISTNSRIYNYYSEYNNGSISLISYLSNIQDCIVYDGLYLNNTYYLLTSNGIYSGSDLKNLSLFNSSIKINTSTTKNASIKYFNETFIFTNGTNKLYYSKDLSDLKTIEIKEYNDNYISKLMIFNDCIILMPNKITNILYTKDLKKFYPIYINNYESYNAEYNLFGCSSSDTQIVFVTGDFSYPETISKSIIFNTSSLNTSITPYMSLYQYLLSKPKYKNIYIDVLLDNKSISNFINNGSIQYDTESKTFSIGIQNNIVMLQNKKFKKQIDTANINNNYSAYDLYTELSSIASEIIGQNFEIDNETKTYMQNMIISYPYLEEDTIWEQLNKLCVLCQLSIYPKNNKIIVQRWV